MEAYQIVAHFAISVCSANRRPQFELRQEFTLVKLRKATHGFSPKNYFLEGAFGYVYWEKLQELQLAVKQPKFAQFFDEFCCVSGPKLVSMCDISERVSREVSASSASVPFLYVIFIQLAIDEKYFSFE